MAHPEVGYEVMEKFVSMLTVEAVMERKPTLEGNHMIMVLAPKA